MKADEQLFRIGTELAEVLIFKLKGTRFSDRHDYRRVSLYFFSRAYKCYQALRLLWREGFAEDAHTLARTIYELRLQAIYVSQDPDARSQLFIQHWIKAGYGTLCRLKRMGKDPGEEYLEQFRETATAYECLDALSYPEAAERAISKKWWGKTIKGLAEDIRHEKPGWYLKEYDMIYSQLCEYAHSGTGIFHQFVALSEGNISLQYRPVRSPKLTVPFSATDWLSQIVGHTGRALSLNLDDTVYLAQAMMNSLIGLGAEQLKSANPRGRE